MPIGYFRYNHKETVSIAPYYVLQMTNVQGLVAVVLSGIAFVFAVIGTAIPFWNYNSVGDNWVSEGLWQICDHANGNTECYSLTYNLIELTGEILSEIM